MTDLRLPDLGHHVLEVGCGYRARAAKGARTYVGLDVYQEYLARAHRRYPSRIFCLTDWTGMEVFEDNTFDVVFAIDFIEHLGRREGKAFLKEAARVAPRTAIFTPLGPMKQAPNDGEPESQRHRSAWTPKDFKGWKIKVLKDFHRQLADGTKLERPISAFWAVRS